MRAYQILLNGSDEGVFRGVTAQDALRQFDAYAEQAAIEAGCAGFADFMAKAGQPFPPQITAKEVNPHKLGSADAGYWRIGRNHGRAGEEPGFPHIAAYMAGYEVGANDRG